MRLLASPFTARTARRVLAFPRPIFRSARSRPPWEVSRVSKSQLTSVALVLAKQGGAHGPRARAASCPAGLVGGVELDKARGRHADHGRDASRSAGGGRASLHSCILSVLFLLTSRIMDYLYYIILFINTY